MISQHLFGITIYFNRHLSKNCVAYPQNTHTNFVIKKNNFAVKYLTCVAELGHTFNNELNND